MGSDANEPTKTCRCCGETKPISGFNRDRHAKDGHIRRCRSCTKLASKTRYANTNNPRRADGVKTCPGCKREFPVTSFYTNKATPDGLFSRCKHCSSKAVMKSARANPERKRDENKRWRKKYPEKVLANLHHRDAQKKGVPGKHGGEDIARLKRYFPTCICGAPAKTVDHIVPTSRPEFEPTDYPYNLMMLCGKCNSQKGNKTMYEFYTWLLEHDDPKEHEKARRYLNSLYAMDDHHDELDTTNALLQQEDSTL